MPRLVPPRIQFARMGDELALAVERPGLVDRHADPFTQPLQEIFRCEGRVEVGVVGIDGGEDGSQHAVQAAAKTLGEVVTLVHTGKKAAYRMRRVQAVDGASHGGLVTPPPSGGARRRRPASGRRYRDVAPPRSVAR